MILFAVLFRTPNQNVLEIKFHLVTFLCTDPQKFISEFRRANCVHDVNHIWKRYSWFPQQLMFCCGTFKDFCVLALVSLTHVFESCALAEEHHLVSKSRYLLRSIEWIYFGVKKKYKCSLQFIKNGTQGIPESTHYKQHETK